MQSTLKFFVLIAIVSLVAEGAVYFEKNTKDKYRPGMCYSSVYQISIKMGKIHPTPDCGEMSCDKNHVISYSGCIASDFPADCKKSPEFRSLPYPQCCPSIYCFEKLNEKQEEGSLVI